MSAEMFALIVGAVIGALCSLGSTLSLNILANRRRAKSIRAITAAEIMAIMEKAQRYIEGQSTREELSASTPMLVSIASEIGYLSPEQVIAFRRTVTLDMETRKEGKKDKAKATVEACKAALNSLAVKIEKL